MGALTQILIKCPEQMGGGQGGVGKTLRMLTPSQLPKQVSSEGRGEQGALTICLNFLTARGKTANPKNLHRSHQQRWKRYDVSR